MNTALTSQRRIRVFTVGISAACSLYFLAALVAEPLRTFALDTETVEVEVTIEGAIGMACDGDYDGTVGSGETVSLGTITYFGDTSAYSHNRAAHCRVHTNNVLGYTVSWLVASGSGGMSTGHLISQYEDVIQAFGTSSTVSPNFAREWQLTPAGNTDDSRWGGRVSSTSSGTAVSTAMDFGTDGGTEKWSRVATGSSVAIRTSTAPSQGGLLGDIIRVGFRVQVGALKSQPTGVYSTTVTLTASANT